jgi:heat shock protein HspQ
MGYPLILQDMGESEFGYFPSNFLLGRVVRHLLFIYRDIKEAMSLGVSDI